jgi:Protein of unknown function (DUF3574)
MRQPPRLWSDPLLTHHARLAHGIAQSSTWRPVVTEAEFQRFLDLEITPRFPDGLTLLTALGQFRGSSGVIQRERSMLLILLYPRVTARSSSVKIEEIRAAYVCQFNQQSVLRADERLPECVSF